MLQISRDLQDDILDIRLVDLLCKHVYNLGNRSRGVLEESTKIGYMWCLWGSHSGNVNKDYHLGKILKMEQDGYEHAIRIVKCDYGFSSNFSYWTDNLHSTIMYIRKYGYNVRLRDVKFYLVDLETEIIYDYKNSLLQDEDSISGAYNCAVNRFLRSNSENLLEINYRLHDFILENSWIMKD